MGQWEKQLELTKKGLMSTTLTHDDRIQIVCTELETLATQNCGTSRACRCLSILSNDEPSKKAVAAYIVSTWAPMNRQEQKIHLINHIKAAYLYEEEQEQEILPTTTQIIPKKNNNAGSRLRRASKKIISSSISVVVRWDTEQTIV